MSFTWVCPSGRNCCGGARAICCGCSKCVGGQRGGAFNNPPIASTLLLTGLLAPSRSNTQDGNGRAVRKQTSAQLLVFPSLSLCAALSQTTTAHNGGGGKARQRAQRYGNKLKGNQRRHVVYDNPGCTNHH